ncbi:hypothetical protein DK926_01520 [Rhodococcus sp. Eu-32]|uniref:hypothetical protein n=1 Tax=Rhodococcus sp. Eu-32 TaxID=1017319 RepID=UPI000DF44884|nr:hypothetical protein [Rhodococcus sp. Eu-32]RRQ29581.1 hypothetical protein DK926_01520 [Rhodococcus sp. Eu-32]
MTENNTNPEDTGQISVAELLARNGQKGNFSTGGRRRRGVKGGISVAELTGEIPVVRDEPTAGEAPVITPEPEAAPKPTPAASKAAESKPAESKPSEPKRAQPEPELLSGSTTAAGDLMNKAHDENERRPYGSVPSQRPVPITSRSRSTGFVQRNRSDRAERDAEPKTDVTARTDGTSETQARPKPAVAQKPVVAPRPAVAPKPEVASTPEAKADTTSTTAKPVTRAMPAVERPADGVDKDAVDKDEKNPSRTSNSDDAVTEITDAVTDDSGDSDAPTTPAKKDAAKQWLVLAGQGVVAIVVGALLFKGFEKLWDMLPWVALILAVLVIVGLVAVVRILRRTDDMISMVIAIAVGVFVTLGPLAFQLSTG